MHKLWLTLLFCGLLGCPQDSDDDDSVDDDDASADDDDATADDDDAVDDDDSAATDDDDSADDDDDAVDDDDSAADDDDATGCEWIPHATIGTQLSSSLFGFGFHPPTERLAIATAVELEIHDVSDPDLPVYLRGHGSLEVGPWGQWGDLAEASWGFAAIGQSSAGPMNQWHLLLVEQGASGSALGSRAQLSHDASHIAVDGDAIAVVGSQSVSFFEVVANALVPGETREWSAVPAAATGLGLHDGVALVGSWTGDALLVPVDPLAPMLTVDLPGTPHRPLWTDGGWLVPQTTNGWVAEAAGISLLDPAAGTSTWVGDAPWISAFDADDGPFQIDLLNGELLLANSESGMLRADYDPLGTTIPTATTLTAALWPEVPSLPRRMARDGSLLAIAQDFSTSLGLVEVCGE